MIGYVILMFLLAIVFAVVGMQIYRGKTNLIHDYHQTKVTDKEAYAKAFGKVFMIFPASFALCGGAALLGDSIMWLSTAILMTGLVFGIAGIIKVQKKYNGGVF